KLKNGARSARRTSRSTPWGATLAARTVISAACARSSRRWGTASAGSVVFQNRHPPGIQRSRIGGRSQVLLNAVTKPPVQVERTRVTGHNATDESAEAEVAEGVANHRYARFEGDAFSPAAPAKGEGELDFERVEGRIGLVR